MPKERAVKSSVRVHVDTPISLTPTKSYAITPFASLENIAESTRIMEAARPAPVPAKRKISLNIFRSSSISKNDAAPIDNNNDPDLPNAAKSWSIGNFFKSSPSPKANPDQGYLNTMSLDDGLTLNIFIFFCRAQEQNVAFW